MTLEHLLSFKKDVDVEQYIKAADIILCSLGSIDGLSNPVLKSVLADHKKLNDAVHQDEDARTLAELLFLEASALKVGLTKYIAPAADKLDRLRTKLSVQDTDDSVNAFFRAASAHYTK